MAIHSSILAWRIPGMGEPGGLPSMGPGGLPSMGLHRVGHDWSHLAAAAAAGLPVHHQLLESTQTHVHCISDAIQPSHPVIPSIHLPKANFPTSQTLHERWESDSNILYSWPHFKFQNLNPYLKITFYSQVFRYFLSPLSALCHYWVEYLPILLPLLDGIPSVLIRSVMSDSSQSHGLQSARLLCPQGFSRQEYWRRLPCPPPGDLPNPGTEPRSPALWADSISYHSSCHLATRTHLYKSLHRVLSSTFHLL